MGSNRSSKLDHSETVGSALKRTASNRCSEVSRTRRPIHTTVRASASVRVGLLTHVEQFNASCRSAKQIESCDGHLQCNLSCQAGEIPSRLMAIPKSLDPGLGAKSLLSAFPSSFRPA